MVEAKLHATERVKQKGKFKESGFVPGAMYGDGIDGSISVKFETSELAKILTSHGRNAKLSVGYEKEKYPGIIKELQREPVSGRILHVDIQVLAKDHVQSFKVPIVFQGESELQGRQLMIKVHKPEITLQGTLSAVPESIAVDVSGKASGDTITLHDLKLSKKVTTDEADDAVFATVTEKFAAVPEEAAQESETENE